jgi:hypothetical protein
MSHAVNYSDYLNYLMYNFDLSLSAAETYIQDHFCSPYIDPETGVELIQIKEPAAKAKYSGHAANARTTPGRNGNE